MTDRIFDNYIDTEQQHENLKLNTITQLDANARQELEAELAIMQQAGVLDGKKLVERLLKIPNVDVNLKTHLFYEQKNKDHYKRSDIDPEKIDEWQVYGHEKDANLTGYQEVLQDKSVIRLRPEAKIIVRDKSNKDYHIEISKLFFGNADQHSDEKYYEQWLTEEKREMCAQSPSALVSPDSYTVTPFRFQPKEKGVRVSTYAPSPHYESKYKEKYGKDCNDEHKYETIHAMHEEFLTGVKPLENAVKHVLFQELYENYNAIKLEATKHQNANTSGTSNAISNLKRKLLSRFGERKQKSIQ